MIWRDIREDIPPVTGRHPDMPAAAFGLACLLIMAICTLFIAAGVVAAIPGQYAETVEVSK